MLVQDATHPTGVSTDGDGDSGVHRARQRKAMAALALRRDNYTWQRIAETLGFPTPRAALVAVEGALEAGLATDESQEFMRRMAGEHLQILLAGVMRKARDPEHPEHLAAVSKAREIVMDHAKLMGYLAPQEVAIYTPLASEIQQFVGDIIKSRQPDSLTEDDIFADEPPLELEQGSDGTYGMPEEEHPVSIEDF